MSAIADIKLLGWVIDKLASYSDTHKLRVNDAISSIHIAWTHTYDYLRNKKGEYNPNQKLSNLWSQAARNTRLVDFELAKKLKDKSRFWIHPDLPRQNRIILLKEIADEVERLEKKF